MPSIIFPLVFVFLTNFLIKPTACVLPTYLQNFELDDITSLQHELPSIIGKISIIVNQFDCPIGWTHIGGSCYYLPKTTSIPIEVNHTCNQLHSNRSNLMQIRNTVELFYAAYILTKNDLSALMINIDPNLLKEKRIAENLMNNQSEWQHMRDKFREERVKYYKLREKILDELISAGLRISRRSKNHQQKSTHNDIEEYKYDNLDSENEIDEFERIDNIQGICDRIDWNVINNDSAIYKLTTALISDKIVCSFSNIEPDIEYRHVCEYVLNFCFANVECGKHGHCINTLSSFKCSCLFLYDGLRCERISKKGLSIIIAVIIFLILNGLSIKPIRWALIVTLKLCINRCLRVRKDGTRQYSMDQCHSTITQETTKFIKRNSGPIKNPNKRDFIRIFWVSGLSILFLILLLSITHFTSYKYDVINGTVQLAAKCEITENYQAKIFVFCPTALALIFIFSWSIKRENRCLRLFDGRPGLIPPIEPFRTANRFTTATVFGIIAFEVLKIFEDCLFNTDDLLNGGILIILFEKIALALMIGLQYYPILASLQLRNIIARFFVCLYVLADIIYTIIREGSCMGFLPLSKYYSPLEEAKLRMELGTWFIIYGLIKNTPHFILLSYIAAEVFVRFGYDTIYVPSKKKKSIWSAPVAQPDESAFAKYYVTKLFRRNLRATRRVDTTDVNIDTLDDFQHEVELQKKGNPSCVKKFFDSVYQWDDDFRFTTLATCTYTVAIIFLYYLACTLVFLYISSIINYIDAKFNIEFKGFFSLRSIVIISAVITVLIFAYHLYIGMRNYKKHKLQLFKGIYEDIPSPLNFNPNAIASKSIHYFGFLVSHMTCGFLILFHLIFFSFIAIRIISLKIRYNQLVFHVIIPQLIAYILIMVSISTVGRFLFIRDMQNNLNLKHRKLYAILVYFIFFADCFLGIISCFIRLIKSTFLNVIYMSRLDCCLNGRPLEKFDYGYVAYISYLHMEVTHTNPIMLAFCYSLYDDIIKRRPKHCYDDECCTAPDELDHDETIIELKPISNVATAHSTISHLGQLEEASGPNEIIRQKRARFRWFLAYTILNNYHLFDLRRQVQTRLARIRIARSNLIDEKSVIGMETPESPAMQQRETKSTPSTPEISVSSDQRPAAIHRLLSVPVPFIDD